MFKKAEKSNTKLRLALCGPTGSGKTYSALAIAQGLGQRVAFIDTECGSASLYADRFDFDVVELDSGHPEAYIRAIHAAEKAGYDVLIIDSLSHAWMGRDGALELVDKAQKRSRGGNSFTAWREVTPLHNQLVDALVRCKCHLIATMRSKMAYEIVENDRGRKAPKKLGLQPLQRDGMEYEFTILLDLNGAEAVVTKTRMPELNNQIINKPGKELGERMLAWLQSGKDPDPSPAPGSKPSKPKAKKASAPKPETKWDPGLKQRMETLDVQEEGSEELPPEDPTVSEMLIDDAEPQGPTHAELLEIYDRILERFRGNREKVDEAWRVTMPTEPPLYSLSEELAKARISAARTLLKKVELAARINQASKEIRGYHSGKISPVDLDRAYGWIREPAKQTIRYLTERHTCLCAELEELREQRGAA